MRTAQPRRPRPFAWCLLGFAPLFAFGSPARAGVGVWTPVGPPGGSVSALAVSPRDPELALAGTPASGVFKSVNGGLDWSAAGAGLIDGGAFPPVSTLKTDPHRPEVLYAGTRGAGVYRSADGGNSWSRCGALPPDGFGASVSALEIEPGAAPFLYAATANGVFRSADGCKTWAPRKTGLPARAIVLSLGIDPAGRYLYAGVAGAGVYRSPDQGGHWVRATSGVPQTVLTLGFDPRSPSVVFAGTPIGLYRSVDRGHRWGRVRGDVINRPVVGFGFQALTGDAYAATPEKVFVSSDRGVTWARVPGAVPVQPLTSFAAGDLGLLAGSNEDRRGGGIAFSADGGTRWIPSNAGFSTLRPTGLAFHPADPFTLFVSAGPAGISVLTNRRRIWSHWPLSPTDPPLSIEALAVHPGLPGVLFAGAGSSGVLLRSDGSDGSWRSAGPLTNVQVSVLEVDPRSPGAFWIGGFGTTYHTPDGGLTWKPLTLAANLLPVIHDIEAGPFDPQVVTFAGAWIGGERPPRFHPLLYRSTDGGTTWRALPTANLPGSAVRHFTIDRDAPGTFYAATDAGLFRSEDEGETWQKLLEFQDRPGDILATPGALYASRGASVLRSTDRGETWVPIRSGLGARPVERLWLDPLDPRHLYAGTFNAGLYEYTLPPAP